MGNEGHCFVRKKRKADYFSMLLLNFMFLISDLLPLPEEVSDAIALNACLAAKLKCSLSVKNLKQVVYISCDLEFL